MTFDPASGEKQKKDLLISQKPRVPADFAGLSAEFNKEFETLLAELNDNEIFQPQAQLEKNLMRVSPDIRRTYQGGVKDAEIEKIFKQDWVEDKISKFMR